MRKKKKFSFKIKRKKGGGGVGQNRQFESEYNQTLKEILVSGLSQNCQHLFGK